MGRFVHRTSRVKTCTSYVYVRARVAHVHQAARSGCRFAHFTRVGSARPKEHWQPRPPIIASR
eukprot:scaffold36120_cov169-Isochrysis_galbana.AAC.4